MKPPSAPWYLPALPQIASRLSQDRSGPRFLRDASDKAFLSFGGHASAAPAILQRSLKVENLPLASGSLVGLDLFAAVLVNGEVQSRQSRARGTFHPSLGQGVKSRLTPGLGRLGLRIFAAL